MDASATARIESSRRAARLAAAAPLVLAAAAWAQLPTPPRPATSIAQPSQVLPAAQPTQSQPSAFVSPAVTPAAKTYRARVAFSNNQLTVSAENSSLNEILSEIARLTGMKITGGVADERVYGSYGPDSAETVLNELLDGTGSNVMLLETPQHTVAELILTPRNGGPTPPSPNALRDEDRNEESLPSAAGEERREIMPGGRPGRFGANRYLGNRTPDQQQQTGQQPNPAPANSEPNNPQPDASQQTPNGVKTPQQIYEELVKQQAQQAQQQQTPTTPPQ
jgi:hypothetical protein